MKITSIIAVLLVCVLTPACEQQNNPVGPSLADLTGRWTGNSTYPNAPFELSLLQSDGTLRGEYADRLDSSHAVTAAFSNPTVAIVVARAAKRLASVNILANIQRS